MGLKLSNFSRQLKLNPGIDDDQQVIVGLSNGLWFRRMEFDGEERPNRQNAKETKATQNKTGGKQVAALDSSNTSIGHVGVRFWTLLSGAQ